MLIKEKRPPIEASFTKAKNLSNRPSEKERHSTEGTCPTCFRMIGSAGDTLARYGGDEFTVLLPSLETRRQFEGTDLRVSKGTSNGIAMWAGPETLVEMADMAMYAVKQREENDSDENSALKPCVVCSK